MTSARLRVAIVGLGFGERVLIPAFRADGRCEIAGVCSSRPERAEEVARRLRAGRAYRRWEDAIDDPAVDAVAIATPPALHAEIAVAALRSGRHVLCEKPLTTSVEAAAGMCDAAASSRRANMIDFEFPEVPEWIRAKQIIDAGELGRVQSVAVSWQSETYANRTGQDTWKRRWADGGGALNDMACHCFHYVEWLLGPLASVWAAPACEGPYDTVAVIGGTLAGGGPVSISVGTASFLGGGHEMRVYGERGTLVLENRSTDVLAGFSLYVGFRSDDRLRPIAVEPFDTQGTDGRVLAVTGLVRRFATWALEGQAARPSFQDGLRVQTLVDGAWRSRRNGAVRLQTQVEAAS